MNVFPVDDELVQFVSMNRDLPANGHMMQEIGKLASIHQTENFNHPKDNSPFTTMTVPAPRTVTIPKAATKRMAGKKVDQ